MEIKGIKFYALIGMLFVSFVTGIFCGFGLFASVQPAKAEVTNVMNTTGSSNGINYERVYVNGTYYTVFWNQYGLGVK